MEPLEKNLWATILHTGSGPQAAEPLADAGMQPLPLPGPGVGNLWEPGSAGDPLALVAPAAIVAAYAAHSSKVRRGLAVHEEGLHRSGGAPQRISALPEDPERQAAVFSCWEAKKNVCREVLPPETAGGVECLTKDLLACVESLTPAAKEDCTFLLLMRGLGLEVAGVAEDPIDVVVLLSLPRKKPAMQIWARCTLRGSDQTHFRVPAVPFNIEIGTTASRICQALQVVNLCTSDELALQLRRLRPRWEFFPLQWEELDDDSLLPLRVVGIQPRWEPRIRRRTRRKPHARQPFMLDELDLDPLELGRDAAGLSADVGTPDLADGGSEEEPGEDDLFVPEVPAAFLEDTVEIFEEQLGLCLVEDLAWQPGGGDNVAEEGDESQASDEAVEEDVAAHEPDEASLVEPEVVQLDVASSEGVDPVTLARVDDLGYVTCPVDPWQKFPVLGRITTWPKQSPLEKRNVSCKCYMHVECSTPARRRRAVTDEQLLRWLFGGKCEPLCTRGRSEELQKEHSFFQEVMDGPSSALASTARSSTDVA